GDDVVERHVAAFQHGIGRATGVEADRTRGVIVTRDHVIDAIRRVVGIDHGDHRDTQLLGFLHGDLVIADVDHEQRVRQAVHVLDAADTGLQLFQLAAGHQRFLFQQASAAAVLNGRFHVLQTLDRLLDRLEVGQHAAEPALINEGHAGAAGFLGHDLARLALGADEQDGAAIGGQLAHEVHGFVVLHHGLFEVDDVDLVALAENVGSHLRVPETGLVAEVDTGLEHLTHRYRRHLLLQTKGYASARRVENLPCTIRRTCRNERTPREVTPDVRILNATCDQARNYSG